MVGANCETGPLRFPQTSVICSNKKEMSDFHGTVYFDPAKMLQPK